MLEFNVAPIMGKAASVLWENRDQLSLFFKTKWGKYRNKNIRFSISGLYKINIPYTNDFLLVINRNIGDQLQPPGGAYKRYSDDSLFNKWEYQADTIRNGMCVDEKSFRDLRFHVKGKYVNEVLNWFDSENERERDPRREFKEELIDTGILDPQVFCYINEKRIRRYSKNLRWSQYHGCYEILIFDVFEFLPNTEQKKELINLAKEENTLNRGFAIVTADEIDQMRFMKDKKQIARIGEHTRLIINKDFLE